MMLLWQIPNSDHWCLGSAIFTAYRQLQWKAVCDQSKLMVLPRNQLMYLTMNLFTGGKKKSWPWMFPAHIILASNSLRALLYLLTDQKQYIWSDHYSGSTQVSVYQPPHIPAHRQGCFHVPLSHNTVRKESELPLGGSACLPSATSLNNKTGSHRWHLYLKLQRNKYLQY